MTQEHKPPSKLFTLLSVWFGVACIVFPVFTWDSQGMLSRSIINAGQGFTLGALILTLSSMIRVRRLDAIQVDVDKTMEFTRGVIKKVAERANELRITAAAYARMGLAQEANETIKVADALLSKTIEVLGAPRLDDIIVKLKEIDSGITTETKS